MKNLQKSFIAALLIGTSILFSINPAFAHHNKALIKVTNNCLQVLYHVQVTSKGKGCWKYRSAHRSIGHNLTHTFASHWIQTNCNYNVSYQIIQPGHTHKTHYVAIVNFKPRRRTIKATLKFDDVSNKCKRRPITYSYP